MSIYHFALPMSVSSYLVFACCQVFENYHHNSARHLLAQSSMAILDRNVPGKGKKKKEAGKNPCISSKHFFIFPHNSFPTNSLIIYLKNILKGGTNIMLQFKYCFPGAVILVLCTGTVTLSCDVRHTNPLPNLHWSYLHQDPTLIARTILLPFYETTFLFFHFANPMPPKFGEKKISVAGNSKHRPCI